MRVAVISDIHGNLHALEAVLAAIGDDRTDEIWCLGDVVGYGARPNECCARVAERAALCLVGNHDLAVLGDLPLEDFAPDAAASAQWSQDELSDDARAFLAELQPSGTATDAELYHGSPRDPVWEYVLSAEAAYASLRRTRAPLVLVGHSHVALAIGLEGQILHGGLVAGGAEADFKAGRWLLNPGSVGQPRDGDPRAAYLVLDLEHRTAEFRRVAYDITRTQEEIREAGLPEPLAGRLALGQ
jgi:predicted phosphodiesterase